MLTQKQIKSAITKFNNLGSRQEWQKAADLMADLKPDFIKFCHQATKKELAYAMSVSNYFNLESNECKAINNPRLKHIYIHNRRLNNGLIKLKFN